MLGKAFNAQFNRAGGYDREETFRNLLRQYENTFYDWAKAPKEHYAKLVRDRTNLIRHFNDTNERLTAELVARAVE